MCLIELGNLGEARRDFGMAVIFSLQKCNLYQEDIVKNIIFNKYNTLFGTITSIKIES